jgi:hypothetical protein
MPYILVLGEFGIYRATSKTSVFVHYARITQIKVLKYLVLLLGL